MKGKIFFQNDTIEAMLDIPVYPIAEVARYWRLQKSLKVDDDSLGVVEYFPSDIIGFEFTYDHQHTIMMSNQKFSWLGKDLGESKQMFLKVEIKGKANLYRKYVMFEGSLIDNGEYGGNSYTYDRYVLEKGEKAFINEGRGDMTQELLLYFSDCEELCDRIRDKTYTAVNIHAIVSYYNTECK